MGAPPNERDKRRARGSPARVLCCCPRSLNLRLLNPTAALGHAARSKAGWQGPCLRQCRSGRALGSSFNLACSATQNCPGHDRRSSPLPAVQPYFWWCFSVSQAHSLCWSQRCVKGRQFWQLWLGKPGRGHCSLMMGRNGAGHRTPALHAGTPATVACWFVIRSQCSSATDQNCPFPRPFMMSFPRPSQAAGANQRTSRCPTTRWPTSRISLPAP